MEAEVKGEAKNRPAGGVDGGEAKGRAPGGNAFAPSVARKPLTNEVNPVLRSSVLNAGHT